MSDLIIYHTDDGKSQVSLMVEQGEVWLTQSQLAELFATSVQNISEHIKNILSDNELDEYSVIKDYLITAQDGKHNFTPNDKPKNASMRIIKIGKNYNPLKLN